MKVTYEAFMKAMQDCLGFCSTCEDFTREMTEPDAEHYDCSVCDENNVFGAEQALLLDLIQIED